MLSRIDGRGALFTPVWYLRLATLLPLLLPFPMQAVLRGSALVGARVPDWFGNATMMAGMGLVLFGPVYVIVVGGILLILRRRSWRAHAVAALAAPWLMVMGVGVFQAAADRTTGIWPHMLRYATECLIVGYGYVGLALVGLLILQLAGWVRD